MSMQRIAGFISAARVAAIVLLLIASSGGGFEAFPQTATGSIVGVIRDSSGGVVVGAQITLLNVDKNQTADTVANNLGYYSFPLLQPAVYKLTIQAPGFKQFVQENIKLDVAETLNINANLQVGQVTQSITVDALPPPLETQTLR